MTLGLLSIRNLTGEIGFIRVGELRKKKGDSKATQRLETQKTAPMLHLGLKGVTEFISGAL